LEPTIARFERGKAIHVDRAATAIVASGAFLL
jgi:hypothetical protein